MGGRRGDGEEDEGGRVGRDGRGVMRVGRVEGRKL